MPISGPEMAAKILRVSPWTAVGFITGTPEDEALPADLRRRPVLKKPFTIPELLAFVRESIDQGKTVTRP